MIADIVRLRPAAVDRRFLTHDKNRLSPVEQF
jgi:hypothetical protein